ncbi:MAG: PAS domain-containing protein [Beijerinckiaceae bacterium]
MTHFLDLHSLADIYGAIEPLAGVGVCNYSFKTRRLVWSPGFYAILGIDSASNPASFELLTSMIHPDDRLPADDVDSYLREVRHLDRRLRLLSADGGVRWVAHRIDVFFDARQEPAFAAGILTDITSCVEAEEARDRAEARLRTFTRASHCFTWVVNPDGFKPPSQGWTNLTGQTAEQSSGEGWLDCVHPADRERVRQAFREAWSASTPYAAKYRLICGDGITRCFLARSAPVFDESGVIREWFGVGMDISDVNTANDSFHPVLDSDDPAGPLVKAARALLDWSIEDLASHGCVSISSIRRIESDHKVVVRNSTAERLLSALKEAGIEFFQTDDLGTFVRLRQK